MAQKPEAGLLSDFSDKANLVIYSFSMYINFYPLLI